MKLDKNTIKMMKAIVKTAEKENLQTVHYSASYHRLEVTSGYMAYFYNLSEHEENCIPAEFLRVLGDELVSDIPTDNYPNLQQVIQQKGFLSYDLKNCYVDKKNCLGSFLSLLTGKCFQQRFIDIANCTEWNTLYIDKEKQSPVIYLEKGDKELLLICSLAMLQTPEPGNKTFSDIWKRKEA